MIRGSNNPFRQLDRLANQFDSMFGAEFSESVFGEQTPRVDVAETDDEIEVTIDAPGFNPEDINITIENSGRVLTIRGEQTTEQEQEHEGSKNEQYVWQERHAKTIERRIPLPTRVDTETATAEYTNGVVTITLQKMESEQTGTKIEIQNNDD